MRTMETPVVIIGGGPVGLSMAIDLGWRGISTILLEQDKREARLLHPRMDNVGIRSMEFCRRWGIVKEVEDSGFPGDLPMSITYTTGVLGHELARDEYPDKKSAKPPIFSPQKHEVCPQNFFDPVLQKAAASYSTNTILFGHRLDDLQQDPNGVIAHVTALDTNEHFSIHASYLAACDGSNSTVGRILGLGPSMNKLLACSTNIFVKSPALSKRLAGRRAYRYILIGVEGVWGTAVNIDGHDVWRVQVLGGNEWPHWSDAEIHGFAQRAFGAEVEFEVLSWTPWARREIVAEKYRSGRCFLVGDSAHQLSPTGGYGMNTGMAEAVDLCWKLAGTIQGWGGKELLDSYEAERRPIAVRNVLQGSENLSFMRSVPKEPILFDAGPGGEDARKTIGNYVQRVMQREWQSFGIHLGAVYRSSPIVVANGPALPEQDVAQFEQVVEPGGRAPHFWIAPEHSTLDLFGREFVLLEFSDKCEVDDGKSNRLVKAAQDVGMPLQRQIIDSQEAAILYNYKYVLVRPDGHVAWCGSDIPADCKVLVDTIRGAAPAD